MPNLDRGTYSKLYGPTVGDRLRLGDTALVVEVEDDVTSYGDELLGGCSKTLRDGMMVTGRQAKDSSLDMLISNVVLLDPELGVRKTNIGIKDGRVVGVGRAGNPDVVDNVDLIIDSHTAVIPGEGMIATPGAIDSHVHLASPGLMGVALSTGITTIVGMGLGGVWDVGVNPAANIDTLARAWRDIPVNVSFLARGSTGNADMLAAALTAGASGFKVHEDFGAYPSLVDTALGVAEEADVAVALHTDSLNESGMLSDTLAATRGRTVHAYHVEGGGGHPDLLEIVSEAGILPSSTTPTVPMSVNTVEELFPMTMTVHRQSRSIPSDVEITRSRIREASIKAENVLHECGAISIINSDSMGMGRIGEMVRRTWQLASAATGRAGDDDRSNRPGAHNDRVLGYLAKITINPAIAHGLGHMVGSVAPGKLADIVLWDPRYFGTKPELVVKSGFVAWGASGDAGGSTRISQPRVYRSFFGGEGDAARKLSVLFGSRWAVEAGLEQRLGRPVAAVRGTRSITKADMVGNSTTPTVRVPGDGAAVTIDGEPVELEPARSVPLGQLYHFA